MPRLLVVGPSVPTTLNRSDTTIIHHPLIALRAAQPPRSEILALSQAKNLIITSKHAVFFTLQALSKENLAPNARHIYCVGHTSARAAQTAFPQAHLSIAKQEQQEGVIDLILKTSPPYLAWPRSTKARPLLVQALKEHLINVLDIPLYEPYETKKPPPLQNIDEVFFTCPSSVRAFFTLIDTKKFPHLTFSAIGPITKKELLTHLKLRERCSPNPSAKERALLCTPPDWLRTGGAS